MAGRWALRIHAGSLLLAILFWGAVPVSAAEQPQNLLRNGSFDQLANGQPVNWRTETWSGQAQFDVIAPGKEGDRAVTIRSTGGADAAWGTDIAVQPRSFYRLAGWVKTENVINNGGHGAQLSIHELGTYRSPALTGTKDWTRLETTFYTGNREQVTILALFGGWGQSRGQAWFDGFTVSRIESPQPRVSILAGDERHPISPYIYSQFIEHMGRCIYGGIWAEMLEDRKFFHPVGHRHSPWRAVGPEDAVAMDPASPFVGDHDPVIQLSGDTPAGIVHGRLALREGMQYTGRIWLSAEGTVGPVQVSLIWGEGQDDRRTIRFDDITPDFRKFALSFEAPAAADDARLQITATGQGTLRIGTLSLMPADNIQGMRRDTLELLRQLDAPMYRWPGGNFVSGYDWRDGIGDPDRRSPRANPAWTGIEHNDFGTDEFLQFCRILQTEPLITVNTGFGDEYSAAAWMEYVNGGPQTLMGRKRALNGQPEPYGVTWWGIGNEMFGNWQLGHMQLHHYVLKHNIFHRKMMRTDPSIRTIASGEAGRWSRGMLEHSANHMDLIAEHFYVGQPQADVVAHMHTIPGQIRRITDAHRTYRRELPNLADKDIRIAFTEWNYWYGPHVFGELGTRYFLKDALGIAAGLHEFYRNSDIVEMAHYAQTVNVIGAIKTTRTAAEFESTGLVLKLYRQHYGTIPVTVSGAAMPLEVAAAWSADRDALTISVLNGLDQAMTLAVDLEGVALQADGQVWTLTGPDAMSHNDPGQPRVIDIARNDVTFNGQLEAPPLSVNLYRFQTR
jgi:alpha-L-arabinofuranosidase